MKSRHYLNLDILDPILDLGILDGPSSEIYYGNIASKAGSCKVGIQQRRASGCLGHQAALLVRIYSLLRKRLLEPHILHQECLSGHRRCASNRLPGAHPYLIRWITFQPNFASHICNAELRAIPCPRRSTLLPLYPTPMSAAGMVRWPCTWDIAYRYRQGSSGNWQSPLLATNRMCPTHLSPLAPTRVIECPQPSRSLPTHQSP